MIAALLELEFATALAQLANKFCNITAAAAASALSDGIAALTQVSDTLS